MGYPVQRVRERTRHLLAWLAPDRCRSCDAPPFALCASCRSALRPRPTVEVRPTLDLSAWVGIPSSEAVLATLRELKRSGARGLVQAVAPALTALAEVNPAALRADVLVIPPSRTVAYTERGFRPVELVANAAGYQVLHAFRVRGGVRDQRGLSAPERSKNMRDPFELRPGFARQLNGARVLLLDDVLTTGATLAALRASVLAAGGQIAGIWAISSVDGLR
ncbi:MAG: ComF family protein [Agromyces sp.]